ncbi:hypothetical protein VIBNIAM115_950024 [Vibrio nigripulchritudo AM115]|nr:hypothetical protein VIBNIAM115_950024 [Vibrio nigripulchritudo AM115]
MYYCINLGIALDEIAIKYSYFRKIAGSKILLTKADIIFR